MREGIGRREMLLSAALLLVGTPRANAAPPGFADLEAEYQARLGVYVPATATSAEIAHRADERFAFCSTFKAPLAAAVLHWGTPVNTVINGMTVGQLCDAAIRYSDNAAANLLLDELGGPTAFTAYLRTLGDTVSRLDHNEPELNRNPPGDERDTTTPRAIAADLQRLLLGDALPPDRRSMLVDWMSRITTGDNRIRAGFPADWKIADKTGTGDYGRANDVAVVWSPAGAPYVVAILSDRADGGYDAEPREALIAQAAARVAAQLG